MKAEITNQLLKEIQSQSKPYDIRDQRLKGFMVRVNTSGKLVYLCEFQRGKRITIGKVGVITLAAAREEARKIIADAVHGIDPRKARKLESTELNAELTLKKFIEQKYKPWAEAHATTGAATIARIVSNFFDDFGNKPLAAITQLQIEEWRTKRLKKVKRATINRDTNALKAALNRALKWELITINPMAKLESLKTEHDPIIRYLDFKEEGTLRKILKERDAALKAARYRTILHRMKRNLAPLTDLNKHAYADYLHPMIVLSINTGIRRGELFNLTWDDVDFERATLIAKTSKSKKHHSKARYIPLNSEALEVLKAWRSQSTKQQNYIFVNHETGKPFTTIKKVWKNVKDKSNLKNFRWHDFRHHFASRLVMAGVDLNTVRELLGHSDIQMTLRYAHLAPEHKANAVEKLLNTKNFESIISNQSSLQSMPDSIGSV